MEISTKTDFDGLNVQLFENVIPSPNDIFERLEKEVQYLPSETTVIYVKGTICKIPRRIAAYGYAGVTYSFSGLHIRSEPWTNSLLEIKQEVEKLCGCTFNFVLINRYKDGDDCIGQHKDNEGDLSQDHPIASLSFGETRKVIFKRQNFEDVCLDLKDNSMLVMKSPTNKFWTHGIPRQSERNGVRLNLTFRNIVKSKRKAEDTFIGSIKKEKKAYIVSRILYFMYLLL